MDALRVEFLSDWAVLDVQGTLERRCKPSVSSGTESDLQQVSLWPSDAALLSLSTRWGDAWEVAGWRESGEAHSRFHGARPGYVGQKGRALLAESGGDGENRLLVRPLAIGQSVEVRYQAVLPAQNEQGTQVLDLSLPEQPNAPLWQVVGSLPGEPIATREVEGGRLRFGWRSARRGVSVELAMLPPYSGSNSPWTAPAPQGGASEPLARGRAEYVWHLRSSEELMDVPARAHLVVAIDSSRSLRSEAFQAQLGVADAWIRSHRDAKVALLTYDRALHRVTEGFVPLEQALDALHSIPRELRNGSYQDLALEEAKRLLRSVRGPGRVLLLGDGHTRASLTAMDVRASLPGAARPVLVGLVTSTSPLPSRGTPHLAELLGDFPGVISRIDPQSPLALLREMLTPQSIDGIELVPAPVHASIPLRRIQLDAGEALPEPHRHAEGPVNRAGRLSYRIWGTQYERQLTAAPRLSRLEAAWRSRSGCADANVQRLAHSVTPQSSLFVVLPGKLEPTGAVVAHETSWTCGGTCDDCEAGAIPQQSVGAAPLRPDPAPTWLSTQWRQIAVDCGVPTASVILEVDGIEIAAVELSGGGSTTSQQQACLREAAWSMNLEVPHPDGHGFWLLDAATR